MVSAIKHPRNIFLFIIDKASKVVFVLGHYPLFFLKDPISLPKAIAMLFSRNPYNALHYIYNSIKNKPVEYDTTVRRRNKFLKKNRPALEKKISEFKYVPKISIIMPIYNINVAILKKTLRSITSQIYPNWELCIANGSSQANIEKLLTGYLPIDHRIKVKSLKCNMGIVGNSNEALLLATGEFVAFMDYDDELSADALYEVALTLQNNPEADLIYTDEDKITKDDFYYGPLRKPDWTPNLLLTEHYVLHLSVYRKIFLDKIGWLRADYEGAQDYDLILRAAENAKKIIHIPKILYHWRALPGSTAIRTEEKPYVQVSASKAIKDALSRRGITA